MMRQCDAFAGTWALQRRIDDRVQGQTGVLTGQAVFSAQGAKTLIYAETGQLQFQNGPVMTTSRCYLWQFRDDAIDVFFDDGRPFHSLVPVGQTADILHHCGDDIYRVRYDFGRWPVWDATWIVTGPRKDYALRSRYRPVAARSDAACAQSWHGS